MVNGGVGETFTRKVATPQGCPLSMAVMAMLMRPWILMVKRRHKVRPGVLADDIMLATAGANMVKRFVAAL